MRASTLLALFLSALIGLGVLAAARYAGFFGGAPAPLKEKGEPPKILAARRNLYEGMAIGPTDVQLRPIRPDEQADYLKHPEKYLPPVQEAAMLRVLKKNVEADQPILKSYLEPQTMPEGLSARIGPNMRAVRVSVTREHCAGGLIRVGEYVDVLLTSVITHDTPPATGITGLLGSQAPLIQIEPHGYMSRADLMAAQGKRAAAAGSSAQTAVIARNLRVILKRDFLWPMVTPLPEDKPLQFTLEADPYRAALIEFAHDKGILSLVPVADGNSKKGEKPTAPSSLSDPSSKEYKNEDERVAAVVRGDRAVGDADLERIFNLPPLPMYETRSIEQMAGTKVKSSANFTRIVPLAERPLVDPDRPGYGYHFSPPEVAAAETAGAPKSVNVRPQLPLTKGPAAPKKK